MSTDPKTPKPKAPRKPSPRGKRARDVKDPVEHTDRVVAGTAAGEYNANAISAQKRVSRLRDLIEPKTEAMIKVMADIALDPKVHPSVRMECADRLLSRAYGKPKEHVEITDTSDAATESDEVLGLLNNILDAVGAPRLEAPKPEGS